MASTTAPASILVYVGLDLIGDGLMKLPFVRALRAAFPASRITWLAGKGATVYAGPLRPLVQGQIDEVIEYAGIGSHAGELLRRPLPGRQFDLILDTQRRLLTTLILKRIAHREFLSAAANYAFSDRRPLTRVKPKALIRQLLDLVELASGRPAKPHTGFDLPADYTALARRLLPDGPDYIGLAPGAGGRHKCWPLERFTALGRRQRERGRAPVILVGPAETDWLAPLRAALPEARFPLQDAPELSPLVTIATAMRLRAAVANDAGIGHMLAAGGVPLVSLFGPTSPEKFAPLARRLAVVRAQQFGGDTMDSIPVDAVAEAVDSLLT
jgi:ADP-heptose:LPS heptosyltransferase